MKQLHAIPMGEDGRKGLRPSKSGGWPPSAAQWQSFAAALALSLATNLAAFGGPVTLQVDKTAITEGESVTCTVTRADTAGALTVNYAAGLPKVTITSVTASSANTAWGRHAAKAIDGRLDTIWENAGNSQNEGKDDAPWIAFTFDQVYKLQTLRVANYFSGHESQRAVRDVLIEVSIDGTTFTPLWVRQLSPACQAKESVFEAFPLEGVAAKAVRLSIKSNYAKELGKGTSFDGTWANNSVVGLAEVEFEAVGVGRDRFKPLPGAVVIPDGQVSASFPVQTLDDKRIQGPANLQLRLLAGTNYTVGTPGSAGVAVADNDTGDEVSITATTPTATGQKPGVCTLQRNGTKGDLVVRYVTSTVPVPIAAVSCSDASRSSPANMIDGNLQTAWCNTGNAERESEQIDAPWIIFTFTNVTTVGRMRVANYVNPGHTFRCMREVEVLAATGMSDFVSLGVRTFKRTADTAKVSEFENIDLGGVRARRILFRVKSNYAREFGKGTSFEGVYANGSAVGLAEVEFLTGSTARKEDIHETLTGTVTIPDGKDSVTLTITPVENKEQTGDKTVVLTLIPDFITYSVAESHAATVTIKE